jgi:hypothetical protein
MGAMHNEVSMNYAGAQAVTKTGGGMVSVTDYVSTLGKELGPYFYALHRAVVELHIVWQQYRQLFGEDAETIDVLNKNAALFFQIIQDELWDSVLLRIAALTDAPEMRGRKNLSIRALPALMPNVELTDEIQKLCDEALKETEFAREHRNKRIAHNDHDYHVNRAAVSLNGISRAKVELMLDTIRKVMAVVNSKLRDVDCRYDIFIDYSGARALVHKLRKTP